MLHERIFDAPSQSPLSYIEISPEGPFFRLPNDPRSLVLFIDGACSGNGQLPMAQRKTSVGVYYAPASLFNSAVLLDEPEHRRTNQFAEIYAVGEAISTIHANENTEAGRTFAGLRTVVIVLDSKWVFQCLTEWIDSAWEVRDGSCYNKRANREIQNGEMISRVHNWIEIWRENCDVQVKFWWVNREWNKDADRLARSVLKRPFAPKKTRGRPHARKNRSGPPKPQDLDYPNELAISCYEDTSSPFRSDTPDPENLATDQPISIPSSGAPAVYTLPVHAIYTDHACPTCKHLPKEIPVPGTRIYLDATAFDPHIKHDGIVVRNQSNGALLGKVASAAGSGIGMKTWLRMLRKDKVVVMGKVVGEVRESRDESGSKEVTFKVECVRMGPSLKGFVQKIDA